MEALTQFLSDLFGSSYFGKCLVTFIISTLPVVELRGAIPAAATMGLPAIVATPVSMIANMLPVPFIIMFCRRVFAWMRRKSARLGRLADWFENSARRKSARLYRGGLIGLLFFVAIPLPGTGAWTGAIIAALLDFRLKTALPAILAGVVVAGIIMTGLTYGSKSILF